MSGFSDDEEFVLRFLLYPYQVEFSEEDASDLVISRTLNSNPIKPLVRIPVATDSAGGDGEPERCGSVVDLPFDVIGMCSRRLEEVMNPRIGFGYHLSTRMPFPYNRFPAAIRNRFLRTRLLDTDLSQHLANENARRVLVQALRQLGFILLRKNPPTLVITHDIDTEEGLRRAPSLKAVEDDLGIESTWFVLSHVYPIKKRIAAELSDGCTIGSHDVRHDGKLIHLHGRTELIERMRASKLKLEQIFEQEVRSFRSPLLQFSRRILSALNEAGYQSDFSLPCWEPVHPQTMGGFGIECVQGFETDGIVETPLTLFQDHQVFEVMGMNVDDAIKLWVGQANQIGSYEGDIVLLVHPEYHFSRNLAKYRELLTKLIEIQMSRETRGST